MKGQLIVNVSLKLFCLLISLILFGIASVYAPPRGNLIAAGCFFAVAAVTFG